MSKLKSKEKVINLRKNKGYSYSEIRKVVPVSKSSLSLWLKDVELSDLYKERLRKKQKRAQKRGTETIIRKRIELTEKIKGAARKEIGYINKRELLLIGIVLYWAEGWKQRPTDVSTGVGFGNSDPEVIRIHLKWLYKIVKVKPKDVEIRLHIHITGNETKSKRYWSKITGIPVSKFAKTIFKKHNPKTNRKFNNNEYYGLLRVSVKKSTNLNRKIAGWIEGVYKNI